MGQFDNKINAYCGFGENCSITVEPYEKNWNGAELTIQMSSGSVGSCTITLSRAKATELVEKILASAGKPS